VGDKFASRHAQKGVCSLLADQEDLPFSVIDGMVPDLIISPCALPSRMTIGQLQESIFGKAAAINGNIADATAFIKHDSEAVRRTLRYFFLYKKTKINLRFILIFSFLYFSSNGLSSGGTQKFRCGKTGKLLTVITYLI
jgi:DNA-directed RNA polymerase beta subunit